MEPNQSGQNLSPLVMWDVYALDSFIAWGALNEAGVQHGS